MGNKSFLSRQEEKPELESPVGSSVASAVPQTPPVPVLQEQALQLHIPLLLVQLSPGTGLSLLGCQNHLCNTAVSQEGARESQGYLASHT